MKKKIFLTSYLVLSLVAMYGQDSTQIIDAINLGGNIANALHPNDWIKGIDNSISSAIITAISGIIIGLWHRKKTLRKYTRK